MSDSKKLFTDLDKFIKQQEEEKKQQEYNKILKDLEDLIPPDSQWKAPPPAKKAKAPQPTVRWVKRDSDGNVIYARPSSSRKQSNQAGPRRKADPGGSSEKTVPGGSSEKTVPGGSSGMTVPGGSSGKTVPGGSSVKTVPGGSSGKTVPGGSSGKTVPGDSSGKTVPGGSSGKTVPGGSSGKTVPGGSSGMTVPGGSSGKTVPGGSSGKTVPGVSSGKTVPGGSSGKADPGGSSGMTVPGGSSGKTVPGGSSGKTVPGGSSGKTVPGGSSGKTVPGGSSGKAVPGGSSGKTVPGGSSGKTVPGGSSRKTVPGGSSGKTVPGGSSGKTVPGGSSRKTVPPMNVPDANKHEQFLEELKHSLNIAMAKYGVQKAPPPPPPSASKDWSTRKRREKEKLQAAKPRLLNSLVAKENVGTHTCQECAINPAAVRCQDCQPRPFLCAQCDIIRHTSHVLHNRDAMTAGFFQPLPPTTCIVDKSPCRCERLAPVWMPDNICSCPKEALMVKPGEAVAVVTMKGRYDLYMPELSCEACKAAWTAGVDEPIPNFWPAIQFATLYATDVFFSFNHMKMATPPLSCQAFVRMLNQRTVHFGRIGKISTDCFQESFLEWEAIQLALGNIVKKKKKKPAHS